jgi:amino acid adenylation domain-containing protein
LKTLVEFLSDLRAQGVLLAVDGERLTCNAPKGVVTPEMKRVLADRKPEILAFLRESVSSQASKDSSGPLVDLPLSRSQQRLWFVAQLYPDNPVYNIPLGLQLLGGLDRDALESSLHALVQRHEMLRTSFYQRNGRPLARVNDARGWQSVFVDLSSLSYEEAEKEAKRMAYEEARKPFSLEHAPLFRVVLVRLAERRHQLVLVVHHIVADGWSLGILAKELGGHYSALVAKEHPGLPPIAFQYRDYVQWERETGEKAATTQMPLWLDRLKAPRPTMQFAANRRRSPVQTFKGERVAVVVEPFLAAQLRELCRSTGTTPFMLLLAGFQVVLSQYLRVEDILVGSATSNRQRQELAPLIGFFVNTLVLRTDLSQNPTFRELLSRVKETALWTYGHQDVPFDLLVEKLQPERRLGHSPLVQVMFTLQNVPMQELQLPGLKVEFEQIDPGIARGDLAVEIWPQGEGFRCDFEYSTDIFDKDAITLLQSDYLSVLRHVAVDPSLPIESIPLLSSPQQRQMVADGNATFSANEHPLSRSQRRLWFLDQLDGSNPVYNITIALRIGGPLKRDLFEQSLKAIVDRHESLRTRFLQKDGIPYAVVEDARDWRMQVVDLSTLSSGEQQAACDRLALEEAQKPFSLDRGPLFRAVLLCRSHNEHVVVLLMHHIISDGWSLGVLAHEVGAIYQSLVEGREFPLQPLRVQFRDFVDWEAQEARSSSEADMQYWRGELGGNLAPLELPADHPRPPLQSFRGQRLSTDIPSALVGRLQTLGSEQNASFFMVLFAAFNVLLGRYSGQKDILVGTPTAGRLKSDFEGLVGFFVNNLVLRTNLNGDPRFVDLIQRVRKTALDAFEHQTIPFDQLVEVLQPDRSLDRSPIFQVMFTLQNAPRPQLRLDDLEWAPLVSQVPRARYDLAVDIYLFEETYRCDFEYNTDIFEASTISQMQQNYIGFLETVASNPESPLRTLSLLSERERGQILEEWNRTEMPTSRYATVPAWFHAQAVKSPNVTAIQMGQSSLTYAELDARSSMLANVLRGYGVMRETVVGVYLRRSPEMVVALLGILKAGGAYLPLDPLLPAQRVEFMLSDAGVPLILTQTDLRDTLPASNTALFLIDSMDDTDQRAKAQLTAAPIPEDEPRPEDLAYLIYTSGSTGNPKGTEIPHRALVNLLASMLREPGLSSHDRLVAITTLSFDIAGLEIFGPLLCGAKLILASPDQIVDPEALAALLEESEATVMQATPSTWRMLIDAGWVGSANLRMWCGGEALPPDLAEKLLARGRELWNLYGPTETTIWSAAHRVKSGENPILIGRPIANTRMYILDPDGQPVPIGVHGELYIGGTGVARGYWKRPELTETRFVRDPFDATGQRRIYRTGDLARYRRDGQIQLLGRTDHQIKLRGHRIELGEIEAAIERHSEVFQAVVALHGEGSDQRLAAYVKQLDGHADPERLRPWLQTRLPEYMVPSVFLAIAEIPLTPNGKIDRKRLPMPKATPRDRSVSGVIPRNQTEDRLAQIWSEILGVERPGVRDNFFDLGGHSLLLVRVHAMLRQELDPGITVIDLFRYPTIESLAGWLERRRQAPTLAAGRPA